MIFTNNKVIVIPVTCLLDTQTDLGELLTDTNYFKITWMVFFWWGGGAHADWDFQIQNSKL